MDAKRRLRLLLLLTTVFTSTVLGISLYFAFTVADMSGLGWWASAAFLAVIAVAFCVLNVRTAAGSNSALRVVETTGTFLLLTGIALFIVFSYQLVKNFLLHTNDLFLFVILPIFIAVAALGYTLKRTATELLAAL
jgi:hypothetical protein